MLPECTIIIARVENSRRTGDPGTPPDPTPPFNNEWRSLKMLGGQAYEVGRIRACMEKPGQTDGWGREPSKVEDARQEKKILFFRRR